MSFAIRNDDYLFDVTRIQYTKENIQTTDYISLRIASPSLGLLHVDSVS